MEQNPNHPQPSDPRPVIGYPAPSPAYQNGVAPPQHHAPPPDPRAAALRRFLAFSIAVLLLSGAAVLAAWLLLRPRVPQFWIERASASNLTVTSTAVSGTWTLGFRVLNPNEKLSVGYDEIDSSIFYGAQFLAQTRVSPFEQAAGNETSVSASFSAAGSYVAGWVVGEVDRERAGGSVRFGVGVMADVEFRATGWRWRWRPGRRVLRVLCEEVVIGVSPIRGGGGGSGELVGGAKECRVGLRLVVNERKQASILQGSGREERVQPGLKQVYASELEFDLIQFA